MKPVSLAAEGDLDVAVGRRILETQGASAVRVFGLQGKQQLLQRLPGYNAGARHAPWLVLVDLDGDCHGCAAEAVNAWLPSRSPHMCFRLAVHEVESWLLADREEIARVLGIKPQILPGAPDSLVEPKRELLNCVRRSRRTQVQESLLPRVGSGRSVGALYTSEMIKFVERFGTPERAASRSPSLARALIRVRALVRHLP